MNRTARRIAVSATATAALFGGATATAQAASPEHQKTVVAIARGDTSPSGDVTINSTPNNATSNQLQAPANPGQVPATYNVQPAAASGGAMAGGVVAILVLGIIVFVRVKGKDIKVGDAVIVTLFGIAVAGTVIGTLGSQLTNSAVGSIGGVLSGL